MSDPDWIAEFHRLAADGARDAAAAIILDGFDDLFMAGSFDAADCVVKRLDVTALDSFMVVAVLGATSPARPQLPHWTELAERCRARLSEVAPDRVDRLMTGWRGVSGDA